MDFNNNQFIIKMRMLFADGYVVRSTDNNYTVCDCSWSRNMDSVQLKKSKQIKLIVVISAFLRLSCLIKRVLVIGWALRTLSVLNSMKSGHKSMATGLISTSRQI